MEKKTLTIIILALLLVLGVSLFFNYKQYRDSKDIREVVIEKETKIEIKDDTIRNPEPVSSKTGNKISVKKGNRKQKLELITENAVNSNSISEISLSEQITETDSTYEIPITQNVYEDSLYTAYVSGYHASLDSIFVRSRIVTNNIKETFTLRDTEYSKWNVGIVAGYGYGFASSRMEPFVGIGVTYNILGVLKNRKKRKKPDL